VPRSRGGSPLTSTWPVWANDCSRAATLIVSERAGLLAVEHGFAGEDYAGVDACVHPDGRADARLDVPIERVHRLVQPSAADGPPRVVFVSDGIAKDGHHSVAEQLVNAAVVASDDLARGPRPCSRHRTSSGSMRR
jgi:hypothetical protein